ncbi:hypothetical protein Sjap_024043 [Stephania japonica]|uniref:Uncharacterized protein n=1 Tax=Stephania japonica TaxID=461633 RepID=A0AAP0ECR1_9MAGN
METSLTDRDWIRVDEIGIPSSREEMRGRWCMLLHLHLSSNSDSNLNSSTRIGIRVARIGDRGTGVRVRDPVIGRLGGEKRANVIDTDREDI